MVAGDSYGSKVTPRQRRAVEVLVATGDVTAAAGAASVSRKTVYAWLRRESFRAVLEEASGAALEALSRSLVRVACQAVQVLQAVMQDPTVAASVRVRAADIVLSRLLAVRELVTLEGRVSALEQLVGGGHVG